MPDQSSAATEHAILAEITAPLETLPDDPVSVVHADFPVALRGYDRMAVDAYVQRTSQLVAELQATRSPEAAVRRALERVGEQISGILQRAHETAEEITVQSRREAEDRLEQARVEAAEVAALAAQRVRDLDADTDRIWIERHRIVDDARDLASQLLALAETAADRFPDEGEDDPGASLSAASVTPDPGLTEDDELSSRPDESDEFDAGDDPQYEEIEHQAANEEEDDVLTDKPPETNLTTYSAPEEDTTGRTPVYDDEPGDEPDIEATRRFSPLDLEADEPTGPEPAPPPPGVSRSVIPPASPAANRRQRP
ncbi:MAG: DivIVA domain-containing protein [Actinomycetota bacterium]|nr:DivIVA domain-containing protein [Actinomycetota bacterium]